MPNIWISSPDPNGSPPIGDVDAGGTLINANGGWSRPPGTVAAVSVVGIVVDDVDPVPARPMAGVQPANVLPNALGNAGTWNFLSGVFGVQDGEYYKLAVWLDVEDSGCYYLATPVVFLARNLVRAPAPAAPA